MRSRGEAERLPLLPIRSALAIGVVVLFFSQLAQYVFLVELVPIPPTYVFLGIAAVLMLVVAANPAAVRIESPVWVWALFYATLTAIGFWVSSSSLIATGEAIGRYRALVFMLMVVAITSNERAQRVSRYAVVAVFVGAVLLNVVDLVRPMTFTETLGRAAGLYQNPNISGGAIGMGMLLGMPMVSRAWRPWFLIAAALGVLLTLSRGSVLAFAVAVVVLAVGGEVSVRRTFVVGVAVAGIAVLGLWVTGLVGAATEVLRLSLIDSGTADRLASLGVNNDASSSARATVAQAALAMFAESPWIGHGLGATLEWRFAESTHNMYLRHVAEYGVLGVFLMPSLIYLIGRRRIAVYQVSNVGLAAFVLVWSFFSHNLLDEWPALAGVGIALATPRRGQSEATL